ncbi:MAG: M20/M25/M40 family metallo-hydrolase [Clostridia bacterium]|nr:M20/M25/M40 family metallo-hydrolase [Clostridia bacterium]
MNIEKSLRLIAGTPSVSGYEYLLHEGIFSLCKGVFDSVVSLKDNSVLAVKKCGRENAPKILLNAHIDQIGMYVTAVHEGGFLSVVNIGGIDTNILYASQVTVYGKKTIKGVFVSTPPHLSGDRDAKLEKISDFLIDTGLTEEELKDIVETGTPVVLDGALDLLQNNMISSGSMDDRICMIAIIKAVSMIPPAEQKYDIYALFSSQEEVTSLGASTGVYEIEPDMALVVDVGHANMKGIDKIGSLKYKKGPAVSFSATTSRKLSEAICRCAEVNNIPYQRVSEANNTGTDAHNIQIALEGIPATVLSLPLRNMHTPCEIISLEDCDNMAALISAFVADGTYRGEEVCIVGKS